MKSAIEGLQITRVCTDRAAKKVALRLEIEKVQTGGGRACRNKSREGGKGDGIILTKKRFFRGASGE